ncbi:MAG: DUF4190 domain-containing protein [Clostridium sp.]|nr:DUF4190 domain-containing protein [Clostridium sp.]MCM1444376.1 DUF4190 domain-containing protein [Candidatus Amulumruptor caecigallinarius]
MAKFCENCGAELKENADICLKCGKIVGNSTEAVSSTTAGQPLKYNGLALAGFIVSMSSLIINFAGIVGLTGTILSAVGLFQLKDRNQKGKGMAIAGLCVGIFSILYGIWSIINLVNVFY